MSSTQGTASPKGPRAKHQHSRSATQALPINGGKQSQRRPRGNRANNGNYAGDASPGKAPTNAQNPTFADSAVLSSDEIPIPTGPRNAKKHTQSQISSDRVFSPANMPTASLTDSELPPHGSSATPAKAQGAYAGPTFHASPAPSALPIPKFLSKSVPAKTRAGPPTPPDVDSDSASIPSPSPSPSRAPIPVPPRHQDSPLDMFFKADRAEKARNANGSPASVAFSPVPASINGQKHHFKHDSQSSLNAMFPIELDAETKKPHRSPPPASPGGHRSSTAPSRIPQVDTTAEPINDSAAIQDLLSRLSQSQKKPVASTPPRTADGIPLEPSSQHHSPSPFHDGRSSHRSSSGPTTPAPAAQEPPSSDFHYGNRNLSPLFKAAAKPEVTKRNSGLRTEITADSPIALVQGGFPPTNVPPSHFVNVIPQIPQGNSFGRPTGPRRGSAPHIPSTQEMPHNRKTRTPGRRPYPPRPDSFPRNYNNNSNGAGNGATAPASKPAAVNPFIPSSVQAKKYSSVPKPSDSVSLEQDLKRLLNLNTTGDTTGVR